MHVPCAPRRRSRVASWACRIDSTRLRACELTHTFVSWFARKISEIKRKAHWCSLRNVWSPGRSRPFVPRHRYLSPYATCDSVKNAAAQPVPHPFHGPQEAAVIAPLPRSLGPWEGNATARSLATVATKRTQRFHTDLKIALPGLEEDQRREAGLRPHRLWRDGLHWPSHLMGVDHAPHPSRFAAQINIGRARGRRRRRCARRSVLRLPNTTRA